MFPAGDLVVSSTGMCTPGIPVIINTGDKRCLHRQLADPVYTWTNQRPSNQLHNNYNNIGYITSNNPGQTS